MRKDYFVKDGRCTPKWMRTTRSPYLFVSVCLHSSDTVVITITIHVCACSCVYVHVVDTSICQFNRNMCALHLQVFKYTRHVHTLDDCDFYWIYFISFAHLLVHTQTHSMSTTRWYKSACLSPFSNCYCCFLFFYFKFYHCIVTSQNQTHAFTYAAKEVDEWNTWKRSKYTVHLV